MNGPIADVLLVALLAFPWLICFGISIYNWKKRGNRNANFRNRG